MVNKLEKQVFYPGKLYKICTSMPLIGIYCMSYNNLNKSFGKEYHLTDQIVLYIGHEDITGFNLFFQENHTFMFYDSHIERNLILI